MTALASGNRQTALRVHIFTKRTWCSLCGRVSKRFPGQRPGTGRVEGGSRPAGTTPMTHTIRRDLDNGHELGTMVDERASRRVKDPLGTRTLGSTFRTLHTTHHRSRGRPRFTHTQGRPQVHRQDLKPSLGTQEIPKCTRLERSQDTAWGDIPRGRRDGDLAPGSSLRHAVLAGPGGGAWRGLLKGTFRMLVQTLTQASGQKSGAQTLWSSTCRSRG